MRTCEHASPANPRYPTTCVKCGRPFTPQTATRPRNLEFERQSLERAAYGVMDPERLWSRMVARSTDLSGEYVADPGEVALDRDRPQEVREELEDAINHANWWLETNQEHPEALRRAESLKWLCAVYAAWSDED